MRMQGIKNSAYRRLMAFILSAGLVFGAAPLAYADGTRDTGPLLNRIEAVRMLIAELPAPSEVNAGNYKEIFSRCTAAAMLYDALGDQKDEVDASRLQALLLFFESGEEASYTAKGGELNADSTLDEVREAFGPRNADVIRVGSETAVGLAQNVSFERRLTVTSGDYRFELGGRSVAASDEALPAVTVKGGSLAIKDSGDHSGPVSGSLEAKGGSLLVEAGRFAGGERPALEISGPDTRAVLSGGSFEAGDDGYAVRMEEGRLFLTGSPLIDGIWLGDGCIVLFDGGLEPGIPIPLSVENAEPGREVAGAVEGAPLSESDLGKFTCRDIRFSLGLNETGDAIVLVEQGSDPDDPNHPDDPDNPDNPDNPNNPTEPEDPADSDTAQTVGAMIDALTDDATREQIADALKRYQSLSEQEMGKVSTSRLKRLDGLVQGVIQVNFWTNSSSDGFVRVLSETYKGLLASPKAIREGKKANTVSMMLIRDGGAITANDKQLIEQEADGQKIAAYYDLSMSNGETQEITRTPAELTLSIKIPTEADNGKEIDVIRVHDGKAERLDADAVSGRIEFGTDRFSTYAVVYTKGTAAKDNAKDKDKEKENSSSSSNTSKNRSNEDFEDEGDVRAAFWEKVRNQIKRANAGDIVRINAKAYTDMPETVMAELRGRGDVALVINWDGGDPISIPAGRAPDYEPGRVSWPFSMLARLMKENGEKISFSPESGDIWEVIAPTAVEPVDPIASAPEEPEPTDGASGAEGDPNQASASAAAGDNTPPDAQPAAVTLMEPREEPEPEPLPLVGSSTIKYGVIATVIIALVAAASGAVWYLIKKEDLL